MASRIDSLYRTVFSTLAGLMFSAKEITAMLVDASKDANGNPTVNPASLNVADHAQSAGQAQQYALHCFERVSGGYKVLPVAQWSDKPAGVRGSRGVTQEQALASALAKIKAMTKPALQTNVTPTNPVLPQVASKVNGEAKQTPSNPNPSK